MSEKNDAAKLAAEAKEKDAAKLAAEAKEKDEASRKKVRVICKGTLGPKLLKEGEVTDNEEYVALLETERGRTLVEEVK